MRTSPSLASRIASAARLARSPTAADAAALSSFFSSDSTLKRARLVACPTRERPYTSMVGRRASALSCGGAQAVRASRLRAAKAETGCMVLPHMDDCPHMAREHMAMQGLHGTPATQQPPTGVPRTSRAPFLVDCPAH